MHIPVLMYIQTGPVNGDGLQRSFLEYSYTLHEEGQLCCDVNFSCPACTPEMLAISVDGNRKLYHFLHNERCSLLKHFLLVFLCIYLYTIHSYFFVSSTFLSSDDHAFFDGLFVAEDSNVSAFVYTLWKEMKNVNFVSLLVLG